jgi:acyl-CoA synthetase (AMP-forming)/AMP-acid ligase II
VSSGLFAGMPSPHIKIKIIKIVDTPIGAISNDELVKISCPSNMTGEIVVTGEHVLKEYLNCPEAQRVNKFSVDGVVWHRTGDAGYLDVEGYLHLMGRVKQRIIVNGKEVFPFDVERRLSNFEQIFMGTIIEIDKQVYCVIELQHRAEIADKDILDLVRQWGVDLEKRIIRTRIPRDPRHHSKIDYERLGISVKKNVLKRPTDREA